jgi:hypothetical protein
MVTHYTPTKTAGHPSFRRVALCGALCGHDVGHVTDSGVTIAAGSSSPWNVDCERCLELGARAALDRALSDDVDALTDPDRQTTARSA